MNTLRQTGFSLLEMALSLTVLGFLFTLTPMALSVLDKAQSAAPALDRSKLAVNSAVGFIIQHDRLPCPDTNGDGAENCGSTRSGRFPYRTVGLGQPLVNASGFPLHYAVYQHSNVNLSDLQSSYQPSLLSGDVSAQQNALDFCQGLRLGLSGGLQKSEPQVQSHRGTPGINPAFLFVDPGTLNADRSGGLFDGMNTTGMTYESPSRGQSDDYDDQVIAIGFTELATRLNCPLVLSRVSAAVRNANAAYDTKRAYEFYKDFRKFGKEVRETNLDIAKTKREIAEFNSAASIAMALNDTATALASASGAGAIIVATINAAAATFLIQDELRDSAEEVDEKETQLATSKDQFEAAKEAYTAAESQMTQAIQTALNRDAKGWFQ